MTSTPPVLLVTWNRPDTTAKVLDALSVARPSRIFVAGDGPRNSTDRVLIEEVRGLVHKKITWDCEVVTSFSSTNLGCRVGVTRAIDWFFEHVEEGVILEDDCVPHADFLPFCAEMLERFREDARVLHIAGDNSAGVQSESGLSYCFIRYPHIWGWATWKRAWQLYDRELDRYSRIREEGSLRKIFPYAKERRVWVPILNRLLDERTPDTWDWQWSATLFALDGLSVQPVSNLVSNIGFGQTATHTKTPSKRSNFQTASIFPLRHPAEVRRDLSAERTVIRNTQYRPVAKRILSKLSRVLKRALSGKDA